LRIGWHRWHSSGLLPVHQNRHWLQCSFSCSKVVHYRSQQRIKLRHKETQNIQNRFMR
jgi:hypothetical protein